MEKRARAQVQPADPAVRRRQEQLRAAKRRQRQRQRVAGLQKLELHEPRERAEKLKLALTVPGFRDALGALLDEYVLDLRAWPALAQLAWNRRDRWIPAQEALSLYERNWRFVDEGALAPEERALIERLKSMFGGGFLNA